MKVLFVTTNEKDIATVETVFARGSHQVTIIDNVESALELCKSLTYDVVIANERQPTAITGNEFLSYIAQLCPNAIKVYVSENSDVRCKHAHQQFETPLDRTEFIQTIESFSRTNSTITKKQIVDAVAEIKTLPSPPKVYMQLNNLLQDQTTDSQKIAEVIIQDPALVAKVLHFANSSAMSKGKQVKSIPEAITKMGLDTLCCIVMTAELFSYEPNIEGYSLIDEQLHCLNVAKLAASIVKPELKLDALLAGLLHDIGKLVLFEIDHSLTKQFLKLKFSNMENGPLERKIFGTEHCQIGGYLLHQWNFPYEIIEAVVLHHSKEKLLRKSFGVSQAVFLSDKLIRGQEVDEDFINHYKLDVVMEKLQARAEKLCSH